LPQRSPSPRCDPPQYHPRSNFSQDDEHAPAFVLVGLAFGLAYPRQRLVTTSVSVLMIDALGLFQLRAPGRHARLEDFAIDALAACVGFAGLTFADGASNLKRIQTPTIPARPQPREDDFRSVSHDQSMILTTRRVRGSTITRRSLTTA
jgi:hypothetical protein